MLRFLFAAALMPLLAGCLGGGGSKERQAALTTTSTTTTTSAPGKEPREVGGTPAKPSAKASHPSGIGRQAKLHRRNVCPHRGKSRVVKCTSQVATDKNGTPLTFPKPDAYSLPGINGTVWGFGPKDYHTAYNLPWNAKVQQTIAIVIWGHDPTAKKDLDAFNSAFGLGSFPTCTSLSTWAACFAQVNLSGSLSGPWPVVDGETTLETSIDVQYTHATCLNCRIILIEAPGHSETDPDTGESYFTAKTTDLISAENKANQLHATEINNSYGAPETLDTGAVNPDCQQELTSGAFNHLGVAIVASSGDGGYGASCPADLNTVVAVGGTDLWENADLSYSYETVYDVEDLFGNVLSAPGSGCSALSGASSFQTSTGNWSQTGCSSKRGIADVSASYGGAWIYDSTAGYNNNPLNPEATGSSYWYVAYGTSLAGPIIAGTYGLAGNGWSVSYPAQFAYQHPTSLHDVVTGSNGYCGTIMCQATRGYDGPTGMGTPNGLGGF